MEKCRCSTWGRPEQIRQQQTQRISPIIGFDDSTLCDNIGWLMVQPSLSTVGNLSDESHHLVDSWFILGMVPPPPPPPPPPTPKSSKEREKEHNSKLQQESYICFYHDCLNLILTELKQLSSCKEGVPVEIPGEGIVNLHFWLCMIIGDTKGHDNMCCHHNNHSGNIANWSVIVKSTKLMGMTLTIHVQWSNINCLWLSLET